MWLIKEMCLINAQNMERNKLRVSCLEHRSDSCVLSTYPGVVMGQPWQIHLPYTKIQVTNIYGGTKHRTQIRN